MPIRYVVSKQTPVDRRRKAKTYIFDIHVHVIILIACVCRVGRISSPRRSPDCYCCCCCCFYSREPRRKS